jgi:hypothetical protein
VLRSRGNRVAPPWSITTTHTSAPVPSSFSEASRRVGSSTLGFPTLSDGSTLSRAAWPQSRRRSAPSDPRLATPSLGRRRAPSRRVRACAQRSSRSRM